ncbi:porin family protein [Mesorhizobium sp. BAC0120]|uniref:outer membrane protein n=1 Tax=Mesorhizobium sp. BAC0120 TaxID=3090670 RepID=UPI00298C1454|nr:outer membrane protein [Mesorhizobium sp. BAC0120]MDW6023269.1 porin family protein [Mesorhizobium sp. BAC0120]
MKLITCFAAASAAILFTSTGYAADVLNTPPAPAFTWSGLYLGVNGGYGGGTFEHPFSITDPATATTLAAGSLDLDSSGFLGGVQIGYNFQHDRFVYGIEADIQGANVDGTVSADINSGGFGISAEAGTKVDWFGTVRGRIGYAALDNFLLYGTGGLAYGHVKSFAKVDALGFDESRSHTNTGWTLGGGVEYALTDHFTVKTEYLFTDLGKSTLFDGDLLGAHATLENDVSFHTVRIGLNYKF